MIQRRLISYSISVRFIGGSRAEAHLFHLPHPLQFFHKLFLTVKDSFLYTSHLLSGFQVLFFCWYQVLLCDFPTSVVKSTEISLKPEFPTLKIGLIRVLVGENIILQDRKIGGKSC